VFGSNGFIGRNVCKELEKRHNLFRTSRNVVPGEYNVVKVDLLDKISIYKAMEESRPEVVINCAGVVADNIDTDLNVQFTNNILEQAIKIDSVKKVIISGSAGEYGIVDSNNIPVDELTPLNAKYGYGLSKLKEEKSALKYSTGYEISVIVLRIFNPIGRNMADKFLLTRLLHQVNEYKNGTTNVIELSRLDSKRDYIAIQDVAAAFRVIVEGSPRERVYNVGTGKSTSNGDLLELILKNSKLDRRPNINETSNVAEPLVAVQADITRISTEFGWYPVCTIDEVIEEICL
jgi:nucleoside-diphosphate-sugar epimerase